MLKVIPSRISMSLCQSVVYQSSSVVATVTFLASVVIQMVALKL